MASNINNAPDTDVFAAKKELETRIHAILVKLPGLVRHRLQNDSLWRIAECMGVNENTYDVGRLPMYYKRPTAPRARKIDCLRALATFVVVKWWDYSLEKNTTPYPTTFLDQLDNIIEKGLDAFKVVGGYEKGFRLVTCKKCEDTGIDRSELDKDDKPIERPCTCSLGVTEEPEPDIDNSILGPIVGETAETTVIDEEPDIQEGGE